MQTLTIEITNITALSTLRNLVSQKAVRIIDDSNENSPALPGKTLSLQQFKQWIAGAEASPTVSLKTAKSEWMARKIQLQRLVK